MNPMGPAMMMPPGMMGMDLPFPGPVSTTQGCKADTLALLLQLLRCHNANLHACQNKPSLTPSQLNLERHSTRI